MDKTLATKLAVTLCLAVFAADAGTAAAEFPTEEKGTTTMHASGTFDVKVAPVALDGPAADAELGRFSLEKRFHGDLEGRGLGQMLTSGSPNGSGAYVAIERVTGTLGGRRGSFVFQHTGSMTPTSMHLAVCVVPGSGSGELVGLAGEFTIHIEGGKHSYDFEYTLPAAH